MSEYSDQRDAIIGIVGAVPNVGKVHPRPRLGDAHDLYVVNLNGVDLIRGWEVGLGDPGVAPQRIQQAHRHRYRTWAIRGYHSIDDDGTITGDGPSYDRMMDLAEAIGDALDADQRLGGTCLDHEPTTIGEPDAIGIGGGWLCWGITLTLTCYTVVSP